MRLVVVRSLVAASLFFCCAPAAYATSLSFSGTFLTDDQRWEYLFTLPTASNFSARTLSYAGGVDPNGNVPILAGGFAPVLSLFDPADMLLAYDTGGVVGGAPACGSRAIDAASGFCLDALLSVNLGPGNYRLVLTEWDNTASGPGYADGFVRDAQGNFTDIGFGPFTDPGWNPRDGHFALSVTGTPQAAVPEPSTAFSVIGGLMCFAAFAGLRRARAGLDRAGVRPTRESFTSEDK